MKRLTAWFIAFGGIAVATVIGRAMHLNPSTIGFAFLIIVLFSSLRGGLIPGAVASIAATLCYNFFFLPPPHTFVIDEPSNWVALAAFLVTSVIVSRLVVATRNETARAERRRTELETLHQLSIDLFTATNRANAIGDAAAQALARLGATGGGLVLDTEASPADGNVHLPVIVNGNPAGVLVARGSDLSMQTLVALSRLISLALEREKFLEDSAHIQALRESETLKTSLLRAISHDLTTPLTAITIHTEALRRKAERDDDLKRTVAGISGETGRLRRRIDNLLAMARLEAGKAKPRPEPAPPADLFRAARENLPLVFESRAVRIHVDDDCPDAHVDPSLVLEILVNLIENAHRVSPAGATIELRAMRHPSDPSQVRIEVRDRGPGLPPAAAASDVTQRGLGLEIARSLATANGGSIDLTPREGGGTIARLDVPAALLPEESA